MSLAHALPAYTAGLEVLGAGLYPYQARAIAAMSEPNTAGDGYRYPIVVILWPRRTGKTSAILTMTLGRMRQYRGFRAAYAAQTGHLTSARFREWAEALDAGPRRRDYRIRHSDGTERIALPATRSYLRAFPPIPGRLRGEGLDLVVVDEAQEHDDARLGQQLDADITPVFDTRPLGQWLISGTAGDATSTYFARHYANAVAGEPGYLLQELGTWPADADPDDPQTWLDHHPGLRAGATTLERLQHAHSTLGSERFAREYGNRWATTLIESVFPAGAWAACHDPAAGITGPISLALEVPPDRETAYVVAAGQSTAHPDRTHVELVAVEPLAVAVQVAKRLSAEHRTPIIVDPMAPGVTHIDPLRRARVPLHLVTAVDMVTASLNLYDAVVGKRVTHLDQPPLTAAAGTALRRRLGARWAFDRLAPGGALIVAAALAHNRANRTRGLEAPHLEHA